MKKIYAISLCILIVAVISLLLYQSNGVSNGLSFQDLQFQGLNSKNEVTQKSTEPQELTERQVKSSITQPSIESSIATPNDGEKQNTTAKTETFKKTNLQETDYVFDRENLFSDTEYEQLNHKLTQYEKETTREIVVLTTKSISPYENIADFALNTANEWGIGKAETNNGLFIVVSKQLKNMHIATGLGTEKVLTNEVCQKVVDEQILPEFIQGKFYTGVDKGIDKLMFYWE